MKPPSYNGGAAPDRDPLCVDTPLNLPEIYLKTCLILNSRVKEKHKNGL